MERGSEGLGMRLVDQIILSWNFSALTHLAEGLQFEPIDCSPPAAVHVVTKGQDDLKIVQ